MIKSRNLSIPQEATFESPNYEYLLKTGLKQDKLCDPQRGWINSDSIKIKFAIEFIDSYDAYYDTDQYDDEESISDDMSNSDDSISENEYGKISSGNYFDFQIYNFDGENSGTLKFGNFEINLVATLLPDQFFTVVFSFWTNSKINIIFTFKPVNFNYQQLACPMKKIAIKNRNQKPYEKQVTINFPIAYENVIEDQEGWLKNKKYMVLHINFYYPNLKENLFQVPGSKQNYNTHYSRNYSFKYDNYAIDNNNNYSNNSSSSTSYRTVYHDTSKEDTGCVGLQNQGATCYMNSLLQSLFHIPAFRKIVYSMPLNGQDDLKTSIPLCLQRLFAKLQFSNESCSTKELTTSFGWTSHETFIQHDVQEFCTVLISKLSDKMKGTSLENSLSKLLGGKFKSYIRCIDVDFESSKTEEFFDLSMIVKGVQNLEQSFKTYVEPEQLNGDNQYKTDQYGPQDAIMGTEFIEFPPVLHIHLRRFQFDYQTMRMAKINDRFEFPLSIDLKPYTTENLEKAENGNESHDPNKSDGDFIYDLYGVLVHSGSIAGGHYFAFLRTSTSPQWFKFNDSYVSKATKNEAVDDNFGGSSSSYSEKSYSAYMLVYIRRNEADEIMKPISEEEVPSYLIKYAKDSDDSNDNNNDNGNSSSFNNQNGDSFNDEEKTIEVRFYDEFGILINSITCNTSYSNEKTKKTMTLPTIVEDEEDKSKILNLNHHIVYDKIAKFLDVDRNSFRLWCFMNSPCYVFKDDPTLVKADITMFLQSKDLESSYNITSSPQGERNVIFIKFYHPLLQFPINYIESVEIPKDDTVGTLFGKVREIIGLNEDVELLVFQQYPNFYQQLEPSFKCLISCLTLVFQLKPGQPLPDKCSYNFLTMDDLISNNYFQYFDEKSIKEFELEYNVKINNKKENADDDSDSSVLFNLEFPLYKFNEVMNLSLNQNVQDYTNYRKESIYINVFDFNNPFTSIPFFRISFVPSISLSELKTFIARIYHSLTNINLGYNDSDYASVLNSIQIYKSANKSSKSFEPSNKPIIKQQGYSNLTLEFKKTEECQNIFVLLNLGIPEMIVENEMINIIALFSGDSFNIAEFKIFHIFGNDKDGTNIGFSCIKILQMLIGDEKTDDQVITIQNADLSGDYENEDLSGNVNENSLNNDDNEVSSFNENESNKSELSNNEAGVNNHESSITEITSQTVLQTVAGIPISCIRISLIKGHVIRKVLSPDFQVKLNSIIRFDIISEEERDLIDNGAVQIPVSHISEDDMLTFGDPFFITVVEDEKFENVKKRLSDYLVGNEMMTNQEFMRLSFYFSDADQPEFQKKILWKDMNVLKEMRSRTVYAGQNIVLFILHKTKKNIDMSVKIYN